MSARIGLILALTAASLSAPLHAAPTIALQPGVQSTFAIPPSSLTTSYFFDVPAGSTQLALTLTGSTDVDLLLRYGRPFPDLDDGGSPTPVEYLYEIAHYRSLSSDSTETIRLSTSNPIPVRAGRWYVVAINFSSAASSNSGLLLNLPTGEVEGLGAVVVFDDARVPQGSAPCLTAPWSDSSPASPTGGNSGTTIGQQRRNAMIEAARLLTQNYRSSVPIRIQACWSDQMGPGSSPNGVTLASSGPRYFVRSTALMDAQGAPDEFERASYLPRAHTWYPNAVVSKLAGARSCAIYEGDCTLADFRIRFNLRYDTEGQRYRYGLSPNTGAGGADFISTALHEMTHGMGFAGFVNLDASQGPIGQKFEGHDDIYGANIADVRPDGSVVNFMDETDAQRADALQQFTQLRWMEAEAIASPLNSLRDMPAPENYVRLYTTQPIAPGSTLSHIGFFHNNEIMQPQIINGLRSVGLAGPMLNAVGWSSAPRAVTNELVPRSTQYFDPDRPGHGIDVQRVIDNIYFVVFYTYDANGNPEWYIAIGQILDGVFVPQNNANGDSLVRYRYNPNTSPTQSADPNSDGQIRLDFNQAAFAPACRDGTARDQSTPLVLMTWSIGAERNQQWCMQSLIPSSIVPTPDFTGAWFAGNQDSGWGFSLLSFGSGGNNGLFGLLFYPDAQGNGRWGFVQTSNLVAGTQYTFKERRGYCRTCPIPPEVLAGSFTDVDAGTIRFTINQASQNPAAGNTSTFSVTYQQSPGGTFTRTNSPLILLSAPPQ